MSVDAFMCWSTLMSLTPAESCTSILICFGSGGLSTVAMSAHVETPFGFVGGSGAGGCAHGLGPQFALTRSVIVMKQGGLPQLWPCTWPFWFIVWLVSQPPAVPSQFRKIELCWPGLCRPLFGKMCCVVSCVSDAPGGSAHIGPIWV